MTTLVFITLLILGVNKHHTNKQPIVIEEVQK